MSGRASRELKSCIVPACKAPRYSSQVHPASMPIWSCVLTCAEGGTFSGAIAGGVETLPSCSRPWTPPDMAPLGHGGQSGRPCHAKNLSVFAKPPTPGFVSTSGQLRKYDMKQKRKTERGASRASHRVPSNIVRVPRRQISLGQWSTQPNGWHGLTSTS